MYYPVSALVTLFANILQNPQDPRARSDVRLMNTVCDFLLKLKEEDEGGNVHRMLTLCGEFDRIAKVVLDRAEKEAMRKRKRKNEENQNQSQAKSGDNFPPIGVTIAPQADPNHFQRSSSVGTNTPNAASPASTTAKLGMNEPVSCDIFGRLATVELTLVNRSLTRITTRFYNQVASHG